MWKVEILGELKGATDEDEAEGYEISVSYAASGPSLPSTWGWGGESKIILFSDSGDNDLNPGTAAQFQFAKIVAVALCEALNARGVAPPEA